MLQCLIQTHRPRCPHGLLAQASSGGKTAGVKRRKLNLLYFRIFFVQSRLSILEKSMSRHPARLILCLLLKFIAYTAHFCTFVCNITPRNPAKREPNTIAQKPLSSHENLLIQVLTQILCTVSFSVAVTTLRSRYVAREFHT